MFDYNKYKRVALSIKNSNYLVSFTEWIDVGNINWNEKYPEYREYSSKFMESIALDRSHSHSAQLLNDYFKLFNCNIDNPKACPSNTDSVNPTQISSQLESYIQNFDILIGISTDFYCRGFGNINVSLPLSCIQLLILFLQPFGKIGFVPLKSNIYDENIFAIIHIPLSAIFEDSDFTPETLVIPGDSILKLISSINPDNTYQNSSVIFDFWVFNPQITFIEYFTSKYSNIINN